MRLFTVIASTLLAFLADGAAAQAPHGNAGIAVVGADILPMTGVERLSKQTVLLEGDRIVAVGPEGQVRVPAGYRIIDGHGRFLMPGLVDMHVHLANEPGHPGDAAQRALAV